MKKSIKMMRQKSVHQGFKRLKTYGMMWITSSMFFFNMPVASAETYCAATACEEVYSTDVGGCGYQATRRCPVLAPAVALAVIALTGIIAVALQTDHCHHHSHHRDKCAPRDHCNRCR